MLRGRVRSWLFPFVLVVGQGLGAGGTALAWQAEADGSGVQVLTRGPVHEAFAEPVVFDPRPGLIAPKAPPAAIEEQPPDQRPEGTHVEWIPGYWSWDEDRNDFLWVSGIWRDLPPDRQWVPGYWNPVQGGYQWVSGFWSPVDQEQLTYLPETPASIDAGPNTPAPSANAVWSPGCWYWREARYVWRPGFWLPYQPDWVWVPAHYVWTPQGMVFVEGYWDYLIRRRGLLFAPVAFQQPVYLQPRYTFIPNIVIAATALTTHLFTRPAYRHYYFGDYYDRAADPRRSGFYPWFGVQQARVGYDPIYAQMAAVNRGHDRAWEDQLRADYTYRIQHREARPPRVFMAQRNVDITNKNISVTNINKNTNTRNINQDVAVNNNLVMAQPLAQVTAAGGRGDVPVRLARVDQGRREELTRRVRDLRQFGEERRRLEVARGEPARARVAPGTSQSPLPMNLRRSPVAARANHPPGQAAPPQPPAVQRDAARPVFPARPGRETPSMQRPGARSPEEVKAQRPQPNALPRRPERPQPEPKKGEQKKGAPKKGAPKKGEQQKTE
jgi:hypothetical protein